MAKNQRNPAPAPVPDGTVLLKKVHLALGVLAAVITSLIVPTVTVTLAYSRAKSDVEAKINDVQLQNVTTFAKAADVKEIRDKLEALRVDVSEIKGYLLVSPKTSKGDHK